MISVFRRIAGCARLTIGNSPARLSACVMDGISIGHPRCNADHCTKRLASPRDRFCPEHDHLTNVCAIHGCTLPVADGMRTCRTKAHRDYEVEKRERGQAIFRLKRRLDGHNSNAADLLAPGSIEVTPHWSLLEAFTEGVYADR